MGRKNGPIFEVNRRPIVENEFGVLENSFPVSNTPLKVGSAVALPQAGNKRTSEKKRVGSQSQRNRWRKRQDPQKSDRRGRGSYGGMDDNEMTYLVAPLHEVLCLLVSPLLPRPLLR